LCSFHALHIQVSKNEGISYCTASVYFLLLIGFLFLSVGEDYINVMEEERGQMRFAICACESVGGDIDHIKDIKVSGANTGIGSVIANKGGIVATPSYKSTKISFLSAHLAAHEGDAVYKNRCQSVRTILKEANTSDFIK
jgi:hypothetical protein